MSTTGPVDVPTFGVKIHPMASLDEVFPPDPSVSVPLIMPAGFTDKRN